MTSHRNSDGVLFITHSGEIGGAELGLIDILKHRSNIGESYGLIVLDDGPFRRRLEDEKIGFYKLDASKDVLSVKRSSGVWAIVKSIPSFIKLLNEIRLIANNFELIYANSQKGFIIGAIAGAVSRKPVIWHLRDIMSKDHFSFSVRLIAISIANLFAKMVIVNSEATAKAFRDSGGMSKKLRVVYNGISSKSFDGQDPKLARANIIGHLRASRTKEAEDLFNDSLLIGIFGRLASWKGQHILIEAAAELNQIHLVIVGEASFGEHDYEKSIRDLVVKLNMQSRVHFLGFRNDIAALMAGVDIVVHASTVPEPFGRVIVEGMLAEKPVIAADAGGAREIITHELDGLLVAPGDANSLRRMLSWILEDDLRSKNLGINGRKTAKSKFTLESYLAGVDAAIMDVRRSSF